MSPKNWSKHKYVFYGVIVGYLISFLYFAINVYFHSHSANPFYSTKNTIQYD